MKAFSKYWSKVTGKSCSENVTFFYTCSVYFFHKKTIALINKNMIYIKQTVLPKNH